MRVLAFAAAFVVFTAGGRVSASSGPDEGEVLKGYVVDVDERNGTFGFRETNGRQTTQRSPLPVLMVIADMYVCSRPMTWDDLRKFSNSGRIGGLAVDPSDPSRKVLMVAE